MSSFSDFLPSPPGWVIQSQDHPIPCADETFQWKNKYSCNGLKLEQGLVFGIFSYNWLTELEHIFAAGVGVRHIDPGCEWIRIPPLLLLPVKPQQITSTSW